VKQWIGIVLMTWILMGAGCSTKHYRQSADKEGYQVTEQDVNDGLVLVELDSSELRDRILSQESDVHATLADLTEQLKLKEVRENRSLSDLKNATLQMKFALMDFKRYLGETAALKIIKQVGITEDSVNRMLKENQHLSDNSDGQLSGLLSSASQIDPTTGARQLAGLDAKSALLPEIKDYNVDFSVFADDEKEHLLGNGEARQELRRLKDNSLIAEAELALKKKAYEGAVRLHDEGYVTPNELQEKRIVFEKSENAVESAQASLELFKTYDDVKAVQDTIPGVSVIVPDRKKRDYVYQTRHRQETEIVGTVPWYPTLRNRTIKLGRFINDRDVRQQNKVCILEEELATVLFPLTHALGGTVRVGRHYFEVVGIMQSSHQASKQSLTADAEAKAVPPRLFVALTTAKALFGEISVKQSGDSFQAEEVQLHEVTIQVDRAEQVEPVSVVIRNLMSRNHAKKDFNVIVPMELLRQAERTKRIFNTVLGSIAAISLLVGGIGIMNIMLASVSERTREIGIRRALGAKKVDIISQFLVETAILASTGGLLGVLLGVIIPTIVGLLTNMVTIVTWWSPLTAFSISSLTGIAFGIYPAYQAAKMHPVEALRHE
jgi:putative ABC transport system permease protein